MKYRSTRLVLLVLTPFVLIAVLWGVMHVFGIPDYRPARKDPTRTYPDASNNAFYPVSSLNQSTESLVNTEGYVLQVNPCPTCPPDSLCNPCDSTILVSEHNRPYSGSLSPDQVSISVVTPRQFVLGKKYIFTLARDQQVGGDPVISQKAILIGYTSIDITAEDAKAIDMIYQMDPNLLQCDRNGSVYNLIEMYKDKMLVCTTDADCISANPQCGTGNQLTVVNKTFSSINQYLQSAASACKDCAPSRQEIFDIKCTNGRCTGTQLIVD